MKDSKFNLSFRQQKSFLPTKYTKEHEKNIFIISFLYFVYFVGKFLHFN